MTALQAAQSVSSPAEVPALAAAVVRERTRHDTHLLERGFLHYQPGRVGEGGGALVNTRTGPYNHTLTASLQVSSACFLFLCFNEMNLLIGDFLVSLSAPSDRVPC